MSGGSDQRITTAVIVIHCKDDPIITLIMPHPDFTVVHAEFVPCITITLLNVCERHPPSFSRDNRNSRNIIRSTCVSMALRQLSVAYLFNAWPSPSRACFPPLLSLSRCVFVALCMSPWSVWFFFPDVTTASLICPLLSSRKLLANFL